MDRRLTLDDSNLSAHARAKVAAFQRDVVDEVIATIGSSAIVIVGMAQNPHVARARGYLDEAGLDYRYLEYGSYVRGWRRRLALKMWSGWPTFPQVFVRGELIGGANELHHVLEDGTLRRDVDGDVDGRAA